MSLPSLFEPEPVSRRGKYFKIGLGILAGLVVLAGLYWFLFRFHSEEATVRKFMDQVVAGNFQTAYGMWTKESSYAYSDFLQDWGTMGYYGPVRSYQIVDISEPSDASGVIIVVDVSPFHTFPAENDIVKGQRTKQVRLWVQFSDHSISYAP